MNAALVIALAVFTSVTAPLILAFLTAVLRRNERRADWARQDKVAAMAQQASDNAAAAANRAASKAAEVHQANAETRTEVNDKLDAIHTLVDGNLTASKRSELASVRRELALMQEVIALTRASGGEPSAEALTEVETTRTRLTELTAELREREEMEKRAKGSQDD